MSFMTENKAREILAEYMNAELSGNNARAAELEQQLKDANWKITVGPEGTTVIRAGGGLFSNDTSGGSGLFPQERYVAPYTGAPKSTGNNTLIIVAISVGTILFIVTLIMLIRAIKLKKNAVA